LIQTTIETFNDFISDCDIDLSTDEIYVKLNTDEYKRIWDVAITETNSPVVRIMTENGYSLIGSKKHLVKKYPNKDVELSKLTTKNSILTEEGYSRVSLINKPKVRMDLYDLQVDGEYYLTNGIVSHNSTLVDSIKLGLFGKVSNKTLKSIPNRKNGHGEIKLKFTHTSGKEVDIERKFSPGGFSMFENGDEVSRANKKDLQTYLENEILDINSYVFSNMISLSLNNFNSFLSMTPGDKRKIIDKIFSLSIYNDMRSVIREKIRNIDSDISSMLRSSQYVNQSIENANKEIQKLEAKIDTDNTQKKIEYEAILEKLEPLFEKIEINTTKVKEKENSLNEEIQKLNEQNNQLRYDIQDLEKSIKLYESEKCPTCESDLTTGDHQHKKESMIETLEKIKIDKSKLEEDISKIKEKIEVVKSKKVEIRDKQYELNSKKSRVLEKLNSLKEEKKEDSSKDSLISLLEKEEEKLEELEANTKKERGKKKFLEIIEDVVSDTGVKASVIANVVPLLNSYINENLTNFDLTFSIVLDEKFNAKVFQYGEEIESSSLSFGESKMLDFCVLISMIKILKTKYLNLNVLFLDELFASLDPDNVLLVIKMLDKLKTEMKLNIFIIHQTSLPKEYFDNYIQITKTNGFSNIEYVEKF
jgi:DNA repair exonuclease SbcCD ATPase subunit